MYDTMGAREGGIRGGDKIPDQFPGRTGGAEMPV